MADRPLQVPDALQELNAAANRGLNPAKGGARNTPADYQVFYLNILVLEAKPFEHPGHSPVGTHELGFTVLNHLDDEDVHRIFSPAHPNAGYVSHLAWAVPAKLKRIGATATAELMYSCGSFAALKVTILHANETVMNSHRLITFSQLLHSCTGCQLETSDVLDSMVQLVHEKLPEMLEDDGMLVEIVTQPGLQEEVEYIEKVKKLIRSPQSHH
ncbi:unnamed protein product, partial [Effrenium voratum]